MGVFARKDSPFWYLWLETAPKGQQREKTDITVGHTAAARRDSRQLALDLYHRRMHELAAQVHNLPRAKADVTFEVFGQWYDTHVIAHHRGKLREREILATLTAAFGPLTVRQITREVVLEWRTARAADSSPSTANRETALLKTMLAAAVPKYLEESPIKRLPLLRTPKRETRVLTREEETRLLAAVTPADRALLICALDTLMRLSDVVHLKRSQDRGTYLLVEDPKIAPYKVPVSSRLRAALDALPKDGTHYFAHRRTAKKPELVRSVVKNMLARACKKAKVPYGRPDGITFHSLRHTGATRLVEAGVSLRVVQALGGWKSLRQLERYAHPTEAAMVAAVEGIGSRPTPVPRGTARKQARNS